ncbi:Microcephalin [Phytophthora citrophthora]|uniref:Microcephalin n=1 Tax=Phytophthora citrophthora TaxID=4793 RepID=A0AAD9GSU7_9STRA|nr:Microcephalin [Phytophthora citrophthora]
MSWLPQQRTMTPSMMATRNALPLSNPSTLMYIRQKTATADTETTASADVSSPKPQRDSMTARLSRKMKGSFWSKKEKKQGAVVKDSRRTAFTHHHHQPTKMNAHTRFALPVNTHGNLKYLHGKAQENTDVNTANADKSDVALTATKQRRDSSSAKFSQKMKMLFPGKKLQEKSTLSEEEESERKRSTMSQLVGSHATVQMAVSISLSAPRSTRMATRASPRASVSVSSVPTASSAPQRRRPRNNGPLKGVVAMVDVRVGADAQIDCSDVVARKLRELGASTVKRLSPKLTHMVLSHFTPVWKGKIAKWQDGGGSMAVAATRFELKIVSQLWVNACYVSKKRMDERPFFPVSQQNIMENAVNIAKPKLKRRQSLGAEASKVLDTEKQGAETTNTKKTDANTETESNAANVAEAAAPASTFKINKALNGTRRKRRALSMEPMTSDAILKMLGTTEPTKEEVQFSTPKKQPIRSKSVSSSAKRRRTLNGPPTQQDEDEVTASQASGIVAESESENEVEDDIKEKMNEIIVIPDSQASQPSPAPPKKEQKSPMVLSGSSSTPTTSSGDFTIGTPDSNKKQPTARELRRRNRNSLSYGGGLTLKSGIWSCAACGCSNPRTRRFCTGCQASRGSLKSPGADSIATASPATVASTTTEVPLTPLTPNATTSTPSTPKTKTPTSKRKPRTPGSANSLKTPASSPSVLERTPRSLTRPTASSAAKARTPSPAVSRVTRSTTRGATPSPATRSRTQSPATRNSSSKPQTTRSSSTTRSSLASASVSVDVPKPPVKKAQRKLPTKTPSSAAKLPQSAAKKRARPPVSTSNITTPVVKKARVDSNKENTLDKHMATPGSVSGFMRKHREVNSTPIPMAMSFSSTTSRKTPRKAARNVFGITGVSAEARGVLQCAIHAIDANMANEPGYRKARVAKSVDYAAGVTHLIVGKDTRRTIKVLFAIARGSWIVTEDWAFSSLDQERWLPEEDFEIAMFANKYSREHPESRQIFKGTKFFVGSNVEPSREVLQSLIQVAGGEICNQISVADVCICGDASLFRRAQRTGIRVVTSKWVFDSIATMKLEDDAKYAFTEAFGTPAKTPSKRRAADSFGTPAYTPAKSRRAATSGLESHSTVPE